MAKRTSLSQTNTLLNYFQSPKGKPKSNVDSPKTNQEKPKATMDSKEESDEEFRHLDFIPKKRSRIMVMDSSDSDTENSTPPKNAAKKAKRQNGKESEDEEPAQKKGKSLMTSFTYEKTSTPTSKSSKTNGDAPSTSTASKINGGAPSTSTASKTLPMNDNVTWAHEKLDFLKPDNIRDAKKNKPTDPDYDWRTLYIPQTFLDGLTPAMRQWWELKRNHMDTVLFFKVGKFYELYHMDATVGVNHLGFSYMKGEFAHSGFPETAYGRMASSLIEQGFKVARVEQTETPEMMAERCKGRKVTKFDKVVTREICEISTKGACIYGAQLTDAKQDLPCYMLAIAEKKSTNNKHYGVCFIDTSIGIFYLAEFEDDRHSSSLLALLAQHPPALILLERNKTSRDTIDLVNNLPKIKIEYLTTDTQFLNAEKTIKILSKKCYFFDKNDDIQWPEVFNELLEDGVPKEKYKLAISAFGACLWYLKDCELDLKVIAQRKFEFYTPINAIVGNTTLKQDYMVLDSVTIQNLKLIDNNDSLMKTLDYCATASGKRLLQAWICRPLCDADKIKDRQDAVKELLEDPNLLKVVRTDILAKLPDLERQVAKIHMFGNRFCAKNHPDSRAILYEMQTYSKRKILDLLSTLKTFKLTQEIVPLFENCQSRLLRKITQFKPKGMFHDLSKSLKFFEKAFDQDMAAKEGKIVPQAGIDADYDNICEELRSIEQEAAEYLEEQCQFFNCKVEYFGTDKKRYQLEVPENKTHKATSEYQLEGTRKGKKAAKRYSTPVTKDILARILRAEKEKAKITQDLNRRIFEKFSDRYEEWNDVIQCIMILDVLCSFAEYARVYSQDICLPKVLPFSEKPIINIENGRHPSISNVDTFVPNDTEMGVEHSKLLVLTGPNMGGKSTLMRQVALIVVMAQLGSFVPAASCELSLVDRIFTRLGAYDDLIKKQSTFFVELSEATVILQHATKHSFVLIDELGRGTSTHDGCAIATAYIQKLIEIHCRSIFSTHYHTLVEHFQNSPDIQLGHMACMVENEGDPTEESVTFLYKLADGLCPKSYGFNVAKLAGLPTTVVKRAYEVSNELEKIAKNRQAVANLLGDDITKIRFALRAL